MAEIGGLADVLASNMLIARYSPRISARTEKIAGWEVEYGIQAPDQKKFLLLNESPSSPEVARRLWDWQIQNIEKNLPSISELDKSIVASSMPCPFISIKAYSVQFDSEGWVSQVLDLVKKLALYPFTLEIEVIQCGDAFNSTIANWSFETLVDAGVTLMLGNFPTNPLSFAYLGRHRFDGVKISQAMIPGMHESIAVWAKQREVIKGLIATIKALDAHVVLSGIHREAQLNFFRELDVIQWKGDYWPSASFFTLYEKFCMQMGRTLSARACIPPLNGM